MATRAMPQPPTLSQATRQRIRLDSSVTPATPHLLEALRHAVAVAMKNATNALELHRRN